MKMLLQLLNKKGFSNTLWKYEILKDYLNENPETNFTDEDVDFFMKVINEDCRLGFYTLDSFLTNKKRILHFIEIYYRKKYKGYNIIEILSVAIISREIINNSLKLFLLQKFPSELTNRPQFFNKYAFCDHRRECIMFYLLCHCIQEKKIDVSELNIEVDLQFVDNIKRLLPRKRYHLYLSNLMGCKEFMNFVVSSNNKLLEKIGNIIKKKDVFLMIRCILREIDEISSIQRGIIIPPKFNRVKENYTHFILKRLIISDL